MMQFLYRTCFIQCTEIPVSLQVFADRRRGLESGPLCQHYAESVKDSRLKALLTCTCSSYGNKIPGSLRITRFLEVCKCSEALAISHRSRDVL